MRESLDPALLAGLSPDQLKVLGNRLRYKVFFRLGDRPWSRRELADDLGEPEWKVKRAIAELREVDLVELAATESGLMGGRVYRYRATERPVLGADEWDLLPRTQREAASVDISQMLVREIGQALAAGTFDSHRNRVLNRRLLRLDDQGAARLEEIMGKADDAFVEAEAESIERQRLTGEPLHDFTTGQLSFKRAPDV